MTKSVAQTLAVAAVMLAPLLWFRPIQRSFGQALPGASHPTEAVPGASDDLVSFRIVFGELQETAADYSGSLALSTGEVIRLTPWRFLRQDGMDGTNGWRLHIQRAGLENQPDRPVPLMMDEGARNLVPGGVDATVRAPASAVVHVRTVSGNFDVPLRQLQYGTILEFLRGDVTVQRIPVSERVTTSPEPPGAEQHDYSDLAIASQGTVWVVWQAYKDSGDHVYVRHSIPGGWSETTRLTTHKGDIFRTAVAADASGRVWVVWSERKGEDWNLYARVYDGKQWSAVRQLTSGDGPNAYHRLIRARDGTLHLIWTGYRDGESRVLWSRLKGDEWSTPADVSGPGAWAPAAAADSRGNLYVAWDSYSAGNYDIFLRKVNADGAMEPVQRVTRSTVFQAHPSVALDGQDRVWLAWDESGMNWGKDWTHEDPWRGTTLYTDRRPRVAVLENGAWKQPAADVMAAVPRRYTRFIEQPRIVCDDAGRLWVSLEIRTSSATNVSENWANGAHWERFLTSLEGDYWTPLMAISESGTRPEGAFAIQPLLNGVRMSWTFNNAPFGSEIPRQHEILEAAFHDSAPAPAPKLDAFVDSLGRDRLVHTNEATDVVRIRAYRTSKETGALRILRGDFHRHTEISGDGGGDGSLEDYFRYMLDAAQMDTGIISDHNAGDDNEYTWWRTEKAIDLYHIRGRFTPLFGYERSVPYPNGHRNVVFAQRGVRTLPISREERGAQVNSGAVLYPYLRQNRGIAMTHSLATDQGTDFRDNDPLLEPLVEIYQGYHASYEYEGAPRAESENYKLVPVHGELRPLGFYWNALDKGYKLGVEASSDHISTHTSYTMIYSPSVDRADIVESMRRRHVYGATDNIIVDFQAVDREGKTHVMGEAFETSAAPKLMVKVLGTGRIAAIDIIKNKVVIYHFDPAGNTAECSYSDNQPAAGESYYYVRVLQVDRNMAWSSPVWVKYKPR
jgi:hypothetical protein